jgi:ferrous iron transport protein A
MSGQGVPLTMIRPGKLVTVVGVRAGWGLQRRLVDMGLTSGTQIRVTDSQIPGPVLIDLWGSRLALGHGVAQKIIVKEMDNEH